MEGVGVSIWDRSTARRDRLHGSQVSKARPHGTPGHAGPPFDFTLRLVAEGARFVSPLLTGIRESAAPNDTGCWVSIGFQFYPWICCRWRASFSAPATILESLRRPSAGALPRLQTSFAAASVFGVALAPFARQTHVPMLALDRASPNAKPEPPPPRELRTVGVCARNRQSRFESRIRQKVLAAPFGMSPRLARGYLCST
jgi:hypothetical protein